MASYMNNQAARDLAMGAEVKARQTAIDLLEQAISRIGHPRSFDMEDCPSCGIRAAKNLILNHWRTHDELRAQLNAVRDKAETWYKRYKDQGREDYASAEKTNAAISTAIRQLQDGDARAALDTLMLERYGYPLPEDYVWKAKDDESFKIGDRVVVDGILRGTVTKIDENDGFRFGITPQSGGSLGWYKHCQLRHEPERTEPVVPGPLGGLMAGSPREWFVVSPRLSGRHSFAEQFRLSREGTVQYAAEQLDRAILRNEIAALQTRLSAVEAQLRTKTTMPSAEEQK